MPAAADSFEAVVARTFAVPAAALSFATVAPALDRHLREMQELVVGLENGCDRAFLAGHASDRIGTAFAAGYTEALRALVPEPQFQLGAFAVTESGGGAPRAMQTTLRLAKGGSGTLHGEKTFVTLGALAERIYVVAREGQDAAGRNRLRLVRVRANLAGLRFAAGPALPIVPEVAHARLVLDSVQIAAEDVLPGDAYDRYVKPFRTIEDVHVHAALLGHLLRLARHFALPEALVADLLGSFAGLRMLAFEPPLSPSTHLALGGALRGFERVLEAHADAFGRIPEPVRGALERDLALRFVAAKAREKRLEVALRALRGEN